MVASDGSAVSHEIDLPDLTPFDGPLEVGGDYDAYLFDGLDLGGQRATRARLTRSLLRNCDMHEVDLRDALIADCVFELVNAGALHTSGATLRDVHLEQARIGSFEAYDTEMTRFVARNARLDFVNLRGADVADLRFEQCVITDLDLGAITARNVTFAGCRIARVDCFEANLDRVDFSESEVTEFDDVGHLHGAVISSAQLVALAPVLASHLGIAISDVER